MSFGATEKKLRIPMPFGHREITALARIGEGLAKLQLWRSTDAWEIGAGRHRDAASRK
jgi:hypothetical protein